MVPQEINFDPFFTVRESLRDSAAATSVRSADDDAWIDELLQNLRSR